MGGGLLALKPLGLPRSALRDITFSESLDLPGERLPPQGGCLGPHLSAPEASVLSVAIHPRLSVSQAGSTEALSLDSHFHHLWALLELVLP